MDNNTTNIDNTNVNDDFEDEEIEETEAKEDTSEKKSRKASSPRQIIYVCSAANVELSEDYEGFGVTGEVKPLITECIEVSTPKNPVEFDKNAGKEEALTTFEEKWKVQAQSCVGPMYFRKGPQTHEKKRDTLTIRAGKRPAFTAEHGTGVYKGWKVSFNRTVQAGTVFISHFDSMDKLQKKSKPLPNYYPEAVITDIVIASN